MFSVADAAANTALGIFFHRESDNEVLFWRKIIAFHVLLGFALKFQNLIYIVVWYIHDFWLSIIKTKIHRTVILKISAMCFQIDNVNTNNVDSF